MKDCFLKKLSGKVVRWKITEIYLLESGTKTGLAISLTQSKPHQNKLNIIGPFSGLVKYVCVVHFFSCPWLWI